MAVTDSARSTNEDPLSSELRVAIARLGRRLRLEKPDGQVSDGQLSALHVLLRHGPQTLGELSDHERVTPPSMNRTIGCLTDAGYVTREPSPDDRRKVVVTPTATGLALLDETRRRRDAWLDRQLNALKPAERRTLSDVVDVLRKLAEA